MEIVIRLSVPSDDKYLGELLVSTFVETYAEKMPDVVVSEKRKADLRATAERRLHAAVFVATCGERIVGTITLFAPGSGDSKSWLEDAAEIRYMAVDREFHGHAISERLIERVMEAAVRLSARSVTLHVRRGARGIAKLYSRLGWVRAPEGDLDQLPEIYLEGYIRPVSLAIHAGNAGTVTSMSQ